VALFSNAGAWVRAWENGAAVVSTMPPFQGGLEPIARIKALGQDRESIDPDDFTRPSGDPKHPSTGGFAVWSGTSFAAPLLAGRIAAAWMERAAGSDPSTDADARVAAAWKAVEAATPITSS
jgi:serine protease